MRKIKAGRLLRVFTPFMILLAGLAVLNYQVANGTSLQAKPTAAPTPVIKEIEAVAEGAGVPVNSEQIPIATAIKNGIPSSPEPPKPTPSLTPSPPSDDAALLLGPPAESLFILSSPVTFYWQSDRMVEEDQSFALLLSDEAGEQVAFMVSEPNLGSSYQGHLIPESLDLPPGDYLWQVKLMQQPADIVLAVSDQRSITFTDPGN